jgi:PAS domain S-box-containing protein
MATVLLQQAFDQSPQLQLLLDLDGRIRRVNAAAERLMGLPRESLLGRRIWDPVPQGHLGEAATSLRSLLMTAANGARGQLEVPLSGPDGASRWIEFATTPLRDARGTVTAVLLEGRDQTGRREVEHARREIAAMTSMGRMAARVAHQVNNPLAGIQNAFLLVRDAMAPDHPHARFLELIDREIARIAAITRQLVETYRPDQVMHAEASVMLAVHDAVHFLQQLHRGRPLAVTVDAAQAPTMIPVPDALLRQTLYNLLQHAADQVPPGGTLGVRVTREGDACLIHVHHDGETLTEEQRAQLFEPVVGPVARGQRPSGGGIGLALVRESVLAVGGALTAHAVPTGGTCYDVTFPMTSLAGGTP